MIKKSMTAAAIAAIAAIAALPTAATAACGAAKATNPAVAKAAGNPCAAKKPSAAMNPCNPCAAKSPCGAGQPVPNPLAERDVKAVNTGYFDSIAIKGYDPVAYFTMSKAVKGSEEYSHEWVGVTWQFANEEHRQAFADSPIKYAPQYGGFCAIGVALDQLVANIDPNAWFIDDGKLYLQYSTNVGEDFKADREKLIANADANWRGAKIKQTQ